jgi:lycopene epsilon-cyclase
MKTSKYPVHGCRLVTLAAGAAAGKFLEYERNAPTVAAQTAYGIEVEVEGYEGAYDPSSMLFMDFRRHHSGIWGAAAPRCGPSLAAHDQKRSSSHHA